MLSHGKHGTGSRESQPQPRTPPPRKQRRSGRVSLELAWLARWGAGKGPAAGRGKQSPPQFQALTFPELRSPVKQEPVGSESEPGFCYVPGTASWSWDLCVMVSEDPVSPREFMSVTVRLRTSERKTEASRAVVCSALGGSTEVRQ